MTNEVADLKKEMTTVKAELKQLKCNDSSKGNPEETFSQPSHKKNYHIPEMEEELGIEEDDYMVEERNVPIEEENENHVNTANHHQDTAGTNRKINPPNPNQNNPVHTKRDFSPLFTLFQRQNTQITSGSNLYNTNTLFILAVSIAYQSAKNPTLRTRAIVWMMAWSLVFFLFIQVFTLTILQEDSNQPTCIKHSECRSGYMCNGYTDWWRQPRCEPCALLDLFESSCDVDDDLEDLFENSWFDSHFIANVNMEAGNNSNNFSSEEDAMRCIAKQYCQSTTPVGLIGDGCSHSKQLKQKASDSGYAELFFMSILFAVYLYKDMEEAEVENAMLDFIILSELADSLWISMFIIRITNRARRFILPFYTAYAGAAIILSEDLSAKNITLNLLALIFVIEADNLVAFLVVSANQQQEVENLVEVAKRNNVGFGQAEIKQDTVFVAGFFEPKLLSFSSAIK